MVEELTKEKRRRRKRGSINPSDILDGAFALAKETSVDNVSMPLLAKHLNVGVTSLYWYFRRKDDLLNAMADRALSQTSFQPVNIKAGRWREALYLEAHNMRQIFSADPILCDLVMIRGALSPAVRKNGVARMEKVIAQLVEAGLSEDDAFDTFSSITLHIRGSVVMERLFQKTRELQAEFDGERAVSAVDELATPLIAKMKAKGRRLGMADDNNFEHGLGCILDQAQNCIDANRIPKPVAAKARTPARRSPAKRAAKS